MKLEHAINTRAGSTLPRRDEILRRTAILGKGLQMDGALADTFGRLAHGASGTAVALAHFGRLTDNDALIRMAKQALLFVFRHGKTSDQLQIKVFFDDGCRPESPHSWYRGLGGLLWAMWRVFLPADADEEAEAAIAWLTTRLFASLPAGNICYCHGLTSRLELLRMLRSRPAMHPQVAQDEWLCQRSMQLMAVRQAGDLTWPTEDIQVFSSELWLEGLAAASALALSSTRVTSTLISAQTLCNMARFASADRCFDA